MSLNLHNDNNVYILGAGFSREAGLPLVSDFLTRLRDSHPWLQEQGRHDEAESVAKVLQYRLDAASAAYWTKLDLENIEELFSLASSNGGELSQHIQTAIAATLDYAFRVGGNPHKKKLVVPARTPWITDAPWTTFDKRESAFNARSTASTLPACWACSSTATHKAKTLSSASITTHCWKIPSAILASPSDMA